MKCGKLKVTLQTEIPGDEFITCKVHICNDEVNGRSNIIISIYTNSPGILRVKLKIEGSKREFVVYYTGNFLVYDFMHYLTYFLTYYTVHNLISGLICALVEARKTALFSSKELTQKYFPRILLQKVYSMCVYLLSSTIL